MNRIGMFRVVVQLSTFLLIVGVCRTRGYADGGQIRASEEIGGYRITVFTSPMPLRAGLVDVSVLVQDVESGEVVSDAAVTVELTSADRQLAPIRLAANTAAATNKLLQAAVFDLPAAGDWRAEVTCELRDGESRTVSFALNAAPPLPAWLSVWPWFSWPVVAVLLFALHRWRVARFGRNG